MNRANGIIPFTPHGKEIRSSLSAAYGSRVIKNAVIAIFSRGISSIFTACIASKIKLISKRMTMIFSNVLGFIEITNPSLYTFSSDKNPTKPEMMTINWILN
ncbi:MAG: hypothetical protein WCB46_10855 [Methanoregula sp.]